MSIGNRPSGSKAFVLPVHTIEAKRSVDGLIFDLHVFFRASQSSLREGWGLMSDVSLQSARLLPSGTDV